MLDAPIGIVFVSDGRILDGDRVVSSVFGCMHVWLFRASFVWINSCCTDELRCINGRFDYFDR